MIYDAGHAEQLNDLLVSEGWKIMSSWLEGRIEYHKSQLVDCKMEEVETHRARIKAYVSVMKQPQGIIDEITETVVQRS